MTSYRADGLGECILSPLWLGPTLHRYWPGPATRSLSHACHAKEAETKGRQGIHPTPWQCTLSHACHAKEAETKGRQGVHPTPWQCTLSHACHAKDAETKGRQGVHPTPWQCTLSHACHAKDAETKGRQGNKSWVMVGKPAFEPILGKKLPLTQPSLHGSHGRTKFRIVDQCGLSLFFLRAQPFDRKMTQTGCMFIFKGQGFMVRKSV